MRLIREFHVSFAVRHQARDEKGADILAGRTRSIFKLCCQADFIFRDIADLKFHLYLHPVVADPVIESVRGICVHFKRPIVYQFTVSGSAAHPRCCGRCR